MHIVETLFLNPFEKWVHYGRFPCKFVLHLLLALTVTAQAVIYFQRDIEHVSRTNQHFVHMFTSGEPLHSPEMLQHALADLISNHFLINNRSIVRYELSSPDRLTLHAAFRDGSRTQYEVQAAHWLQTMKSHQEEGYLKEVFPIIFDLDNLPMLREISATQRFEEIGYVQNHEEDGGGGFRCLYHWELVTAFDGRAAGDFVSHLDALAKDCAAKEWQIMHILSVTVAILAVISILLIARKIRRSVRVISAFRSSSVTWAQLSAQDIASMLSIWWAMALASNFVQLVAAVECLRLQPEIGHRFMWVGFSCFLTWMNMIQYFESFPSYFIAFHTIAHSGMRILQLFFSVAPFFFAFILLGVCLFWKSAMFADPQSAAEMLFSLMNGDSIHDAFKEVRSVGGILLQAYLYLFVFLAIYVILNVNISIVEDAYHEAKQRYMSRQRNEEPELFPDRVRRALEEESPELDTLELLYGHHVHSDAERSSAEPNFHQRLHPHAPHGSDATDTSESSGLFSRTVSGKYISPRLLESPKLQRALVSTFAESRQRAQSLPARGFTVPADPRSSVDGSSGAEQLNVSLGTSSSSAESRAGLELCKEDNPPGPETEMQCVVVLPPDVVDALVQLQRSSQQLRSQAGSRPATARALDALDAAILAVEHQLGEPV